MQEKPLLNQIDIAQAHYAANEFVEPAYDALSENPDLIFKLYENLRGQIEALDLDVMKRFSLLDSSSQRIYASCMKEHLLKQLAVLEKAKKISSSRISLALLWSIEARDCALAVSIIKGTVDHIRQKLDSLDISVSVN